jgi:Dolichyl-phosphate-mannose-protein mannosyltransferase
MALVTLAGAVLRARYLSQPMRYDEAFTYLAYASQPLTEGLARYDYPNNHLLHTLLVHVTTTVFGNQPWSLRLPAYTAGVALVPAWWWAVRGLYPGAAGLLTAGLVAGSSPLVEYSTNARGYMLVALDCALLVGAGVALLRRATLLRWVGLAALIALGLWTVPVALFPVGAVAAWLGVEALVRRPPGGRSRFLAGLALALVAAGCLTVVLYLPVLRSWGVDAVIGNRFVAPLGQDVLLRRLPSSLAATWQLAVRDAPRALVLVLLAGVVLGLVGHRRLGAQRVPLLAIAVIWCAGLVLIQRVVPFPRVWLFLFPPTFGTAAAGLTMLWPRRNRALGASLAALVLFAVLATTTLASGGVLRSPETGTLRAAAPMAAILRDRLAPGDAVVAALPANEPLAYYLDREGIPPDRYLRHPGRGLLQRRRLFVVVDEAEGQTLQRLLAAFGPGTAHLCGRQPRELGRWESGSLYQVDLHAPPVTQDNGPEHSTNGSSQPAASLDKGLYAPKRGERPRSRAVGRVRHLTPQCSSSRSR